MEEPVKRFSDMSAAEQREFERTTFGTPALVLPHANKKFAEMTLREQEEFEASLGILPPLNRRR